MPSFRVMLTPGALRPGATAESVIPAAAEAVGELAVVEASDLAIVRAAPRIVVRFMAEDDELALQIAGHAASVTDRVVEVASWSVTRRVGGRWLPVSAAEI